MLSQQHTDRMRQPAQQDDHTWVVESMNRLINRKNIDKIVVTQAGSTPPSDAVFFHQRAAIFAALSGQAKLTYFNGKDVTCTRLQSGTVVLALPGSWRQVDAGKRWRSLGVICHAEFLRYFVLHGHPRDPQSCKRQYHSSGPPGSIVSHTLTNVLGIAKLDDTSPVLLPSVLAFLHAAFVELTSSPGQRDPQQLMHATICEYINDHCHLALDRNTVAEHFNMHPNSLSRLFRQLGSHTYKDYLLQTRLERAVLLLQQSQLSIAELGRQCGLHHTTYFIKCFKRRFGLTPGQFRHKNCPSSSR